MDLSRLGRYEVIGTIGVGGMATVYLGRVAGEAGFQRLYAVKVLHPHLASEPGFVTMLLDEARIAARLHHPNVVPIVDLGSHENHHFVAMEYVEGASLSALLRKRRTERAPRLLVPLVLDMLAGLDAAHSLVDDDGNPLNLVHRDVSPQNVLVGVDGNARITDFGIARAESRLNTTRPGELKGKYMYMAPEQIKSKPVDRRADVFSAGAMLWSMLTGRKLFQGDNDAATMNNILHMDVPKPSEVGFAPPAAFDDVCMRALARDPADRFASAQDMEEALREAANAAGGLAARREVATWIADTFREELAERRAAIRGLGGERARTSKIELPSFTPSSLSDTATPLPPEYEMIETTGPIPAPAARDPKRRRLAAILAGSAVAVIGIGVWFAAGSSKAAPAAPVTQSAAPLPPPSPPPSPSPSPSPPPSPPPSPSPSPAVAAPAPHPAPPRPPAPVRHAKAAPPAHSTVSTPAPKPSPSTWDKDSPLPPP